MGSKVVRVRLVGANANIFKYYVQLANYYLDLVSINCSMELMYANRSKDNGEFEQVLVRDRYSVPQSFQRRVSCSANLCYSNDLNGDPGILGA